MFLAYSLQIHEIHWLTVGMSLRRSEGKWAHYWRWVSTSETCSPRERFLAISKWKNIENITAIGNYLQHPPASTLPLPCPESPGLCSPEEDRFLEGIGTDFPSIYLHGPHGLSDTGAFKIRKEESQKPQWAYTGGSCLSQLPGASPALREEPGDTDRVYPARPWTNPNSSFCKDVHGPLYWTSWIWRERLWENCALKELLMHENPVKAWTPLCPKLIKPSLRSSLSPKIRHNAVRSISRRRETHCPHRALLQTGQPLFGEIHRKKKAHKCSWK